MLPIQITDKAYEEIHHIFVNKKIPSEYALRVGIKGQGCAGVDYMLGFDKPTDEDKSYTFNEIKVIISKKDFMYLLDLEIDYLETAESQGFVFNKDN